MQNFFTDFEHPTEWGENLSKMYKHHRSIPP